MARHSLAGSLANVARSAEQLQVTRVVCVLLRERHHVIEVIDSISGEQGRQIDLGQHATPLVTKKDRVSCPLWEWLTRHLPAGGSKLGGDQRAVGTQVVGKTSIETHQERPIHERQMEGSSVILFQSISKPDSWLTNHGCIVASYERPCPPIAGRRHARRGVGLRAFLADISRHLADGGGESASNQRPSRESVPGHDGAADGGRRPRGRHREGVPRRVVG
jgi:hypothetical protein